jgi:hypothetical protein
MADPRYAIDWAPPDIGPGAQFISAVLNSNRANDRADEYAQMQRDAMARSSERESAALARQKEEDERKHQIEAFNAMPMLQRAALRSVAQTGSPGYVANNPYGVKFDVAEGQPPSLAGVDIMKAAGNAYGLHAQEQLAKPAETPAAPTLAQGQEGPEEDPRSEAMRFEPHEEAMEGPQAPSGIEEAQNVLAQPHQRKLFSTFGGQRFEVAGDPGHTPFGPEYDTIYQGLLDTGEDPHKAMQYVAAQYKADQTQEHIASRTADQIAARQGLQGDRLDFQRGENAKYRETHAGRMELVDEAGKFKVAASAPGLKADAANARDMSLLERAGSAIRQTGQFAKLAASDKTVRGLMLNIANGTTPLQHKDAQIQLARFFRQAQPTEGEMHLLYNNLGGTMDKWNQFVARISTGDLSAEQMRQLKASATAVRGEHNEDVRRFVNVMKARLGPGGGFDLMPDQAQKLYESMGAELGLENLPPLYQTEGGVQLGSGKRPNVQPRGTKKNALDELESQLDALGGGGGR